MFTLNDDDSSKNSYCKACASETLIDDSSNPDSGTGKFEDKINTFEKDVAFFKRSDEFKALDRVIGTGEKSGKVVKKIYPDACYA